MTCAHLRFPAITLDHLVAETARELAQRTAIYPRHVESARMAQHDADFQIAAATAWLNDAERLRASWFTPRPLAPAAHAVSWGDRRAALARELGLRQRCYPLWIETARLLPDTARHQLDCLLALAAIYDDGFDWIASNGARPSFASIAPDSATLQARAEWSAHCAALQLARNPEQQGEMIMT